MWRPLGYSCLSIRIFCRTILKLSRWSHSLSLPLSPSLCLAVKRKENTNWLFPKFSVWNAAKNVFDRCVPVICLVARLSVAATVGCSTFRLWIQSAFESSNQPGLQSVVCKFFIYFSFSIIIFSTQIRSFWCQPLSRRFPRPFICFRCFFQAQQKEHTLLWLKRFPFISFRSPLATVFASALCWINRLRTARLQRERTREPATVPWLLRLCVCVFSADQLRWHFSTTNSVEKIFFLFRRRAFLWTAPWRRVHEKVYHFAISVY